MNTFKSTLMLVGLMLLLVLIGERIGGEHGMIIALAISVAMNFTSYFFSDKIALSRTARSRSPASSCRAPTKSSSV